jgi:hypothetical protein
MATLNIDGRSVQVDDGFLSLSHDQQNATVEEIAKSFGPKPLQEPEAVDHGLSERQKLSPVEKAISPITSYPATYDRMNKDAREQVAHGVDQLSHASGAMDYVKGAANTALGAAGYVASPISAAYRSVIGQPIEDVTGIPREQTEFAAQLLTPGIGLTGAAKAGPVVKAVEQAAPSIQELKAAAKAGYQGEALSALEVKPAAMADFATRTKAALDEGGLSDVNAPKVHATLDKITQIPDTPSALMTGRNIQSVRQALGHAAASTDPQERLAASRAIDALDAHIPKIEAKDVLAGDPKAAGEALDTANANYAAAKQAESIDNKVVSAELRAAASNSGQNVANTIRQRMASVVDPTKPKEGRGLLPDERASAEEIARGTRSQNLLRGASNVLGGGGGLGMLHTGAVGAAAGSFIAGPVGAAIGAALPAIAGHTLKAISNKMTLTQAAKLSEMIRSRAPLASSMDKFEVSASALSKSRDPRAISGAILAARNLSNNLRASGFNVSPTDLLSGIQGTTPSAAGQNK